MGNDTTPTKPSQDDGGDGEQAHVPCIRVGDQVYYADRCYLNEMASPDVEDIEAYREQQQGRIPAGQEVVLFSRGKLVESLAAQGVLQAVILSTYNVDLPDVELEFPSFFRQSIPTLLLHGDIRVRREYNAKKATTTTSTATPTTNENTAGSANTSKSTAAPPNTHPYKIWKEVKENQNIDSAYEQAQGNVPSPPFWCYDSFPPHIQVQQVVPYFPESQKRALGRFHPKFCLLFTTGYVYVVISTANLNPQQTVDLSWVQAFSRHDEGGGGGQGGGGGGGGSKKQGEFCRVLDDFLGRIDESLGSWAEVTRKQASPPVSSRQQQQQQQQSQDKQQQKREAQSAAFAAAAGCEGNGPRRFLQKYVVGGDGKLASTFDFSTAAVDLVTSAPCTADDAPSSSSSSSSPSIKYGLERMTQLLKRRQKELPPSLPPSSSSSSSSSLRPGDKLRVQVTSICQLAGVNNPNATLQALLELLLHSLLPDLSHPDHREKCLELIWPTLSYIKTSRRFKQKYRDDLDEDGQLDFKEKKLGGEGGFLIPDDCVALQEYWKRMRTWGLHPKLALGEGGREGGRAGGKGAPFLWSGESYGVPRWTNVLFHCKTYSRSLALPPPSLPPSSSDEATAAAAAAVKARQEKLGEPLQWLWLTSANFSAGALGFEGTVRSFEMGVLFHSSVKKGVMYRTWPLGDGAEAAATVAEEGEEGEDVGVGWRGARTVYLPLPYRLDAPWYCEQVEWDDTPDLLVPPYFHSYHNFMYNARLKPLAGAVEQVFAEVREDLRALRGLKKGGGGGGGRSSGSSSGGLSVSLVEEREGKRARVDGGASVGAGGEGKE